MSRRKTRTGIALVLVFGLVFAVWSLLSPGGGPVSNAGLVGAGQDRAAGKVSTGTREGFKGSDEELAVTGDR